MSTESSQIFHQSAPRHDHVAAPFVTSVRAAPLHTLDTPLFPHIVKPAKACGHLYAVRQSGSQGCRSPAENVHQTIESHWRKPPTAGFRGRGGGCLARSKTSSRHRWRFSRRRPSGWRVDCPISCLVFFSLVYRDRFPLPFSYRGAIPRISCPVVPSRMMPPERCLPMSQK